MGDINKKFTKNDPNIIAKDQSGDNYTRRVPGSQPWYKMDDIEFVNIRHSSPYEQYYQGDIPVDADTVISRYTSPWFGEREQVGMTYHSSPIKKSTWKPEIMHPGFFQQGGSVDQKKQQMFIQYLAQKYKLQSQEELEAKIQELGEEGIKKEYAEFEKAISQKMKFGAKLNYIKGLKGQCPSGYELRYYKNGGKTCVTCEAIQKSSQNEIDSFKCGRKMKKRANGGDLEKKVVKAEGGTDFDIYGRMVPGLGTYLEAKDLYNHPSWGQAGWTALSALGDIAMFAPVVGPAISSSLKAAKIANTAAKAAKVGKTGRLGAATKAGHVAAKASLNAADYTAPALGTFMVRPSGAVLTLPFRDEPK